MNGVKLAHLYVGILIICTFMVTMSLIELIPNGKVFYLFTLMVGLFFAIGAAGNLIGMTNEDDAD